MSKVVPSEATIDVVEENRNLFERLAESDVPISEEAERALELLRDAEEAEY